MQSYPAPDETRESSGYGMYWFDEPPFDAVELGKQMQNISQQMAIFFHDPVDLYRIFIRHNPHRCASGTGYYRSFMFGWTSLLDRDDSGFLDFLVHEAVHEWPLLGSPTSEIDETNAWFTEGIADYYSVILNRKFGIYDEKTFLHWINAHTSAYYTNPSRNVTNRESVEKFWDSDFTIQWVPYQRGFMYFLQLEGKLRGAKRSLDDLILEMVQRRLHGRPYHINVWLRLVEAELGETARDDYESMAQGKLMVPSSESLGDRYTLQRKDQEEFVIGFAPNSTTGNPPRKIRGLDL